MILVWASINTFYVLGVNLFEPAPILEQECNQENRNQFLDQYHVSSDQSAELLSFQDG